MKNKKPLINNALGAFEIALFMPRAAKRFQSDRKAMFKSFMIPVLLLPATLAMVLFAHPQGHVDAASAAILAGVYTLRLFIYLAGFFAFGYILARTLDKMSEFYNFVTANNWLSLPIAALMLVPAVMAAAGHAPWESTYSLIVLITLYSCACTAFLAACAMRIPYEMAGFLAITGLMIHHNALGFVKWAAVNTLPLLA